MYNTIKDNIFDEITEKKSKFIANVFYVESKEEAENIIKEQKKKYYDARHNCYAYRILDNGKIIERFNDDGEPSGTAGAPILTILSKQNIVNVLVIVTRYFGGILLGTGGLVKAYSKVTKNAFEKAKFTNLEEGFIYNIEIKYANLEKFKYFIQNNGIKIIKEEYFDNVILNLFVPKNNETCLKSEKINDFNIIKMKKKEKTNTKKS